MLPTTVLANLLPPWFREALVGPSTLFMGINAICWGVLFFACIQVLRISFK